MEAIEGDASYTCLSKSPYGASSYCKRSMMGHFDYASTTEHLIGSPSRINILFLTLMIFMTNLKMQGTLPNLTWEVGITKFT